MMAPALTSLCLPAVAALGLMLSGCLDLTETVTVRADGTARVSYEIGLDQTVYNLARTAGDAERDPVATLCGMAADVPMQDFSENLTGRETRFFSRDRDRVCALDLELKDIRAFTADDLRLAPPEFGEALAELGITTTLQPVVSASVTELADGLVRLEQRFALPAAAPAGDGDAPSDQPASDALARALFMAMFSGRHLTVRLEAEEITDTNGTLSNDGRSVSWRIPLAQILDRQQPLERTFHATIRYLPRQ